MTYLRTLAVSLTLALLPLSASYADPSDRRTELGLDNAIQGFWERLRPELENLRREMEPALEDAFKLIEPFSAMDDPRHYRLPEVLPNGDIIIRRREEAPDFVPRDAPEPPPEADGSVKT